MIIKSKQAFAISIKILAICCLFSCKDSNQPTQLLTETAQQNLMAVDSKNDDQAKLKERADAGDANAQRELGTRLLASEKAEDKTDGLNLIKKAATQGNTEAQNQLGNLFFASLTVSQNKEEAFKWYLKAAEQGFTSAQNMIYYMLSAGDGTEIDKEKAFFWQKSPLYLAMPQDNSILESHILMAMELRRIHKKERSGS
jgi:TPR repeat protein